MQIKNALPISILLLIAAIIIGILIGTVFIMLPALERMESLYVNDNLERAQNAIIYDGQNLESRVSDWAQWDDTYIFMQDQNQEYIQSNLVNETFTTNQVNFIIYFDTAGNILYSKGFDYSGNEDIIGVPPELVEQLHFAVLTGDPGSLNMPFNGLIALPENPVLIAADQILYSNETGQPRGIMVMARYYGDDEIERISEQTATSVSLYQLSDPEIYLDLQVSEPYTIDEFPVLIPSIDGKSISALVTIDDITGHPKYILKVDTDRYPYLLAMESVRLFISIVMVIGTISFILMVVAVKRRFTDRLTYLKENIEEIGEKQNYSEEIILEGDDELTALSCSFNQMLGSIEEHITEQQSAEKSAQIATEKLKLLTSITRHDIVNQITVIEGYTNLLEEELKENAELQSYARQIEKALQNINQMIQFTKDYEQMGTKSPEWKNVSSLFNKVEEQLVAGEIRFHVTTGNLEIYADPLLEKVFYNLSENTVRHAMKATCIDVSFHTENGRGTLIYRDDGIGIEKEMKEKIFEKGFGKNTGVGLFLSREILSITGITITEKGVPGEGAEFEIVVPSGYYRFSDEEMSGIQ